MNVLFIIDDPDMWKKSMKLDLLFTQGRHFNITTILSGQHTKNLISACIKNNMHYLFFNEVSYNSLETLYDSVFIKCNKREFFEYIYEHKGKYVFMFYENGGDINDCFK